MTAGGQGGSVLHHRHVWSKVDRYNEAEEIERRFGGDLRASGHCCLVGEGR